MSNEVGSVTSQAAVLTPAECPPGGATVTKLYKVTGSGDGTAWSWCLYWPAVFSVGNPVVDGVTGSASAVVAKFVTSINAACGNPNQLRAVQAPANYDDYFVIQTKGSQDFKFGVGPANTPCDQLCEVGLNAPCSFNPDITEVPLSDLPILWFVSIEYENSKVTLTWTGDGKLEVADTVTGPWLEIPDAKSPYTYTVQPPMNQKFFRLKGFSQPGDTGVINSDTTIGNYSFPQSLLINNATLTITNTEVQVNGDLELKAGAILKGTTNLTLRVMGKLKLDGLLAATNGVLKLIAEKGLETLDNGKIESGYGAFFLVSSNAYLPTSTGLDNLLTNYFSTNLQQFATNPAPGQVQGLETPNGPSTIPTLSLQRQAAQPSWQLPPLTIYPPPTQDASTIVAFGSIFIKVDGTIVFGKANQSYEMKLHNGINRPNVNGTGSLYSKYGGRSVLIWEANTIMIIGTNKVTCGNGGDAGNVVSNAGCPSEARAADGGLSGAWLRVNQQLIIQEDAELKLLLGSGGNAMATGTNGGGGCPPTNGCPSYAKAGNGGASTCVIQLLTPTASASNLDRITIDAVAGSGNGGLGGNATATGGIGGNAVHPGHCCLAPGARGGDAEARGGNGGNALVGVVDKDFKLKSTLTSQLKLEATLNGG